LSIRPQRQSPEETLTPPQLAEKHILDMLHIPYKKIQYAICGQGQDGRGKNI
jgi:hypothetical protein